MSNLVGDAAPARVGGLILISVEHAVREALATYLRCTEFTIHAGRPGPDELSRAHTVRLAEVLTDFPGPNQKLSYPSASISETAASINTGGFTPSMLEESFDPVCETVLWSLGRAEGTLQVDFWGDTVAMREALGAGLPELFNPYEDRGGIWLQLPPEYACATARYTLLSQMPIDSPDAVWAGERRLQVTIGYEAPLLAKRRARPMHVQTRTEVT